MLFWFYFLSIVVPCALCYWFLKSEYSHECPSGLPIKAGFKFKIACVEEHEWQNSYFSAVSGESFYESQISRAKQGQRVMLCHIPDNPHDNRAIAVISQNGEQIGHIPRDSFVTCGALDECQMIHARIHKLQMTQFRYHLVLEIIFDGAGKWDGVHLIDSASYFS